VASIRPMCMESWSEDRADTHIDERRHENSEAMSGEDYIVRER